MSSETSAQNADVASAKLSRRLLTVLAADMVDYSKLTEVAEEETHLRLRAFRVGTVNPFIVSYRGNVIRNTGDGFLAVFDSSVDALDCAMEIQREIAEVEFALLVSAMDIRIEVAQGATVRAPRRVASGQEAGYEIGRACGQLACAYASIEGGGVVIDSLAQRLGHLAGGLMSPKTVAERLGWVMGIRDRTLVLSIQSRLELATSLTEVESKTIPLNRPSKYVDQRRAA